MQIHLPLSGTGTVPQRLYRDLRLALAEGRLAPGERLPPSRALAAELGIARQAVVDTYERLVAEGFFEARRGAGTFVRRLPPVVTGEQVEPGVGPGRHWRPLPVWGDREAPRRYNFAGGVTDRRLLPMTDWRRAVMRALREEARDRTLQGECQGYLGLREGISHYLGYSRGLPCAADEVMVTQGAMQGMDLLSRVRIVPGAVVAVEEPGYPPARWVFESYGARVVGVPVDEQGLCVDQVPEAASMIYVTPSHQFPLGMPMTLERRLQLLDFVRGRDVLIVEDDYDGEFRFDGRSLEALKSLDRHQQVVYLGSFSKVLHADLRLGYMIMPKGLQAALRQAKSLTDGRAPNLMQKALANLIEEGAFARHLRRMQRLYQRRRQRLLEALAQRPDLWNCLPQVAGIHLTLEFRQSVDKLEARLLGAGINAEDLGGFHASSEGTKGLLIGFGMIDDEDIEVGVRALARALSA
ncbi:Aminotransferase, classes I and II superfamily [Alloalcanivorax dieselolei B5]|uniref:Aminotransferase, classes I and II superfamily n=1 Tax=Alcanivorax dieselolei (strain DSM 16502 / CGMCC 1.3690 / MCCC 1A00001 / B-5) TaxID=930169 RepID=K0CBF3_ALCDB|nr:PLP-dependent aminotransferase family protein [Alloalcanivorax dieselolei]AFT68796.1 Aminotransferase, classes I and II superfamily [Alloalcanivorax dieselolei B5]GGK06729.1 transcriptional regulator [Alloalcanivorax dieselolei]